MTLANVAARAAPPLVVERRRAERFVTRCNALIRLRSTLTFPCRVLNLTMDAAQVSCDARYALLVHPRDLSGHVRALDLSIALAVDGNVRGLTGRGVVLYRTDLAVACDTDSEMRLGIRFINLDPGARQLLATYLSSLLSG